MRRIAIIAVLLTSILTAGVRADMEMFVLRGGGRPVGTSESSFTAGAGFQF